MDFLTELTVTFLTRASVIAGEVLVIVLIWIKTFRQWRESQNLGIPVSVASLLLRDGMLLLYYHVPDVKQFTGAMYFVYAAYWI